MSKKRLILVTILSVVGVILVALGTSYALFTRNITKDSNFKVKVGSLELAISDLEIVNNRLERITKKAETTKEKEVVFEYEVLKKCSEALNKNIPLRQISFNEDELLLLKNFNLITIKPIIYAANVSEEDAIVGENDYTKQVLKNNRGSKLPPLCF